MKYLLLHRFDQKYSIDFIEAKDFDTDDIIRAIRKHMRLPDESIEVIKHSWASIEIKIVDCKCLFLHPMS